MIGQLSDLLIKMLAFSREHILWCFPTNPISGAVYALFSSYGYFKLKHHVAGSKRTVVNRLLALTYAICLLGSLNFVLENIWLTFFYIRFHFYNGGWLEHLYFDDSTVWAVNYLRNTLFAAVFLLLSKDVWRRVQFTKRTALGISAMAAFLFFYFFATPSYAWVDWSYGLKFGCDEQGIVRGFLLSVAAKPILLYTYSTIFRGDRT